MDVSRRRELARRALEGYDHGPDAATAPTDRARERIGDADAVILVEGLSDLIAVEATAARFARDLDAEGVLVFPAGGAHAFGRALDEVARRGAVRRVAILCDLAEEPVVRRAVDHDGLAETEVHVCVEDLEDELLRAVGHEGVQGLLASQGDLASFRRLQAQPAWRGGAVQAQLRRFLGSGASRKLRYARLLVEVCPLDRLPGPLLAVARA